MNYILARVKQENKPEFIRFKSQVFNREKAEQWLMNNGIENFMLFFEPEKPKEFGDNGIIINGIVGFDITTDSIMEYVNSGKEIILNTEGGDLLESYRIHDMIRLSGKDVSIGVIGICASAGVQILLASQKRWASKNSHILIHNPWNIVVGDFEEVLSSSNSLKEQTIKLAKMYSEVSGKSVDDMLKIMKQSKMLDVEEAKELNLITEIRTSMEEATKIDKLVEKVNTMFNVIFKPKNQQLTDVSGNKFTVEREEGDPQIGDKASPDGSYTMSDGKTITIENGVVTSITEPESESDKLKQEIENLKAKISEFESAQNSIIEDKNAIDKVRNELMEKKVEVDAVLNELKEIRSKIVIPERQQTFTPKKKNEGVDFEKIKDYNDKHKK